MKISDVELRYGTQYTVDLIEKLIERHPNIDFVFMMGADNLLQFPKWKDWQRIMAMIPIAIIARPGTSLKARLGHAARQFDWARLPESQAHILKACQTPAWSYLTLPLDHQSSSAIRARKKP